jgi:myo-inositol-1-phosphate synthase
VSTPQNRARRSDGKVRVAIVGVGNCASSLVQGVEYYKNAPADEVIPGLMHVNLGGYHIKDIEFVAAIDIDKKKVGKDLSDAIFSGQNNTIKFSRVPKKNVVVQRGMTHDGLGKYLSQVIEKAPGETCDIVKLLKDSKADVLVSYLPVGSEEATKWYVEQALAAGVAFVNNIPVFIAREAYWAKRFKQAGLPIIGDDIKSQVGATIMHRSLATLYEDRGVKLERTYQLNVGGNTDFLNMLERERLESKKISKTNAVTSQIPHDMGAENVHIGPSDHVPWLTDRKWAYIRLEGRAFGDVPLTAEVKLEVWDSPNSAGIVIDAVRLIKLALDNGISGPLEWPSAYLMKSPPVQHRDELAREEVEAFIKKYGKKGSTRSAAAKKPASRSAAKKPAVRKPAAKKPAARTAAAAKPATRAAAKPAAKKPATRTAAKPVAKKVVAKKPATRTAAKPVAKKPAVRKPAVRKPAVRKPAVRKPAAKKR